MKTNAQFFTFFVSVLCSLSAPQIASADATSYWAAVGTPPPIPTSSYPYISYTAYTCTANYYVDPSGSDSYSGTSGAPWQTISHAIDVLRYRGSLGGVCVNVGPGTYTESLYLNNLSGTADASTGYLVFRSSTLRAAILQEPYANINSRHSVHIDNSHFVIFDGFTVRGYTEGSTSGFFAMNSHHIKIMNNKVHDVGSAGIASVYSDYFVVIDNVVYNTSCCDSSGTSGIDLYGPVASDTNPGFHNVISRNIVFNSLDGVQHSEGDGIILDNFRATGYNQQTLIQSNLVYDNGGPGINLYYSNNTTILNNTAFNNYRDSQLTWANGEITVNNSSHVFVVNNIAVAHTSPKSGVMALWDQTWDGTNTGNVWANNLSFTGNAGEKSATNNAWCGCGTDITTANGNILGYDPLFVNPAASNFVLQAASPAIGNGTTTYGAAYNDLPGNVRGTPPDIGAY